MTLLPAIVIRSLTVLVLGLTLAVGHIAFAAAGMRAPQNAAASRAGLADNCYVEAVSTRTAKGKVVTHVVRECD
jgi:hypothetical protein